MNKPLALLPSYKDAVLFPDAPGSRRALGSGGSSKSAPYELVGGVAVVPVQGVLTHGAFGFWSETTYGSVKRLFAAALEDPEAKAIALHVDSPGGEVAGCADVADAIYAARGTKPIVAICDELAASAAYWIASAADMVVTPRTGVLGSIGCVSLHADITRGLDAAGITISTIQYGERKTDGYPTTPLSRTARTKMQADVDELGDLFVAAVARNRGLKRSAVQATEAGTFLGREAVRAGLADTVMSADDAFLELMDTVADARPARVAASIRKPQMAHTRPAERRATRAELEDARAMALAAFIVSADHKRRGVRAPNLINAAGPRQPDKVRATAADILAADRRRRGLI